ncbi:hypothetical protein AAFF_G00351280 [Aldrovandia affinis]|uniref:Uncharacterized protein n=1 Tax=Aldrovandia affinis TaxID=143900 RepID=A0AAD7SKZ1_9TELE|nr:hypothetical protein AAFF_G00351280 [Aldrovandia affinis]
MNADLCHLSWLIRLPESSSVGQRAPPPLHTAPVALIDTAPPPHAQRRAHTHLILMSSASAFTWGRKFIAGLERGLPVYRRSLSLLRRALGRVCGLGARYAAIAPNV